MGRGSLTPESSLKIQGASAKKSVRFANGAQVSGSTVRKSLRFLFTYSVFNVERDASVISYTIKRCKSRCSKKQDTRKCVHHAGVFFLASSHFECLFLSPFDFFSTSVTH